MKRITVDIIVYAMIAAILWMIFSSCRKQTVQTSEPQMNPPYVLSATDSQYDYPGDTIYVWVNGRQVSNQSYLVNPGDSVRVYYNPNDDLNTLVISLNEGTRILKRNHCKCISDDYLVIP